MADEESERTTRATTARAKRVIKRYPNRKLYDTQERAFTSLRGLEQMVRQGVDVEVIDHATGNDITEDTLAQVLRSGHRGDADLLSAVIRTPGKIAQAIAGDQDQAREIRELREQVLTLSQTVERLLADQADTGASGASAGKPRAKRRRSTHRAAGEKGPA
jgi:polyhydroxyalkanoate synthesis repressor PhaR